MDEDGYVYFKERMGDTFRRKGENVSLVEVENIISKALNFAPCIAYEVAIPGNNFKFSITLAAKVYLRVFSH